MKRNILSLFLVSLSVVALAQQVTTEKLLLSGWRFQRGACQDAEQPSFNDSKWQQVSIPHDWAISGPFNKDIDKQVVAIEQNGEAEATEKTGRSGSLPWIGEAWYRTEIDIPEGYGHAELIFDGAMSEPRVYLDGSEVGYWAYGYNTFKIDITSALPADRSSEGYLLPGRHTIAVHLQNVEESSRWYPGAGIYRPVRLRLSPRVGLDTWGTFARTSMIKEVNADATEASEARLTVTTQVRPFQKGRKLTVMHVLTDTQQNVVAKAVSEVNGSNQVINVLKLDNAHLWSPEHPALYTLITHLLEGENELDQTQMKVGIRTAEYTPEGFKLNGQIRKFKGVCLHHDLGPLGVAFYKDAFRRQVRLLKDMGCDAIRTSHNMPAPWQMDICDEMGMFVMAESNDMWVSAKCKNGYSRFFLDWWERDYTNLVLVHRNHPSIVMWSIGNEIPDQGSQLGYDYTIKIQELINRLDGTRPCTQGLDRGEAPMWSGVWQASGIPGFNYRLHVYQKGHQTSPTGLVLGSETASTISSRGVYKFPVKEEHGTAYPDGQISSYDLESCIWSNLPDDDWIYQDKCPWVIGEFVWTGFDYLGEPTPYDEYWPSRSSYFGIFDLAGLPKDRMWLYRTHWNNQQQTLHLLPHWNWEGREGQQTPVFCYTTYPEAELFVNGKSQGRRRHSDNISVAEYEANRIKEPMPWGGYSMFANPDAPNNRLDRYRMRWMDVAYEPGEVKVVAYDASGNPVAEEVVRTAGKPHHIELVADRESMQSIRTDANGQALDCPELTFVTVRIVDKEGNLCPNANPQLYFKVKGNAARFNSCCNGDATSLEVFTQPTMKAFNGQLVVVLQATEQRGSATLTVSGKGLKSAQFTVTCK